MYMTILIKCLILCANLLLLSCNVGNKYFFTWWTDIAVCSYTPEAPEMQLRRLGDLAFMFQLYEQAYQTYHTCKRDFNNDHAWLHYAGALVRSLVLLITVDFLASVQSMMRIRMHIRSIYSAYECDPKRFC